MKIAYIAHPIGGDVKGNIDKILAIIRDINLEEPDVLPFAPYIPDCLCMDDSVPAERERGIKNDHELFYRGFIDEIRLYGDRISKGMIAECDLARVLEIPIVAGSEELKYAVDKINTFIVMGVAIPWGILTVATTLKNK